MKSLSYPITTEQTNSYRITGQWELRISIYGLVIDVKISPFEMHSAVSLCSTWFHPLKTKALKSWISLQMASNAIRTILVFDLPPQTTKNELTIYFQSSKKSGGGDVEKVDLTPNGKIAVITFEDEEGWVTFLLFDLSPLFSFILSWNSVSININSFMSLIWRWARNGTVLHN